MARVQEPVFITGIERSRFIDSPVKITLTIIIQAGIDVSRFVPIYDAFDQRKPIIMTLDISDDIS